MQEIKTKEIDEILKEIDSNFTNCPECKGEGYILTKDERIVEECSVCDGKGVKK